MILTSAYSFEDLQGKYKMETNQRCSGEFLYSQIGTMPSTWCQLCPRTEGKLRLTFSSVDIHLEKYHNLSYLNKSNKIYQIIKYYVS